MTYFTQIRLWSANGNTPITKRGGCYCDEVLLLNGVCSNPQVAKDWVQDLITTTPHAVYGHFTMPDFPNQNIRTGFVNPR